MNESDPLVPEKVVKAVKGDDAHIAQAQAWVADPSSMKDWLKLVLLVNLQVDAEVAAENSKEGAEARKRIAAIAPKLLSEGGEE